MPAFYTRCLVIANIMCTNAMINQQTICGMSASYVRLLLAAEQLLGWESAAEISRGLTLAGYKTSEQTMTNWQARGVSAKGCLAAARIIGCRAQWLEFESGDMTDIGKSGLRAAQTNGTYDFSHAVRTEVSNIMEELNLERQQQVLGAAKLMLNEQRLATEKQKARSG